MMVLDWRIGGVGSRALGAKGQGRQGPRATGAKGDRGQGPGAKGDRGQGRQGPRATGAKGAWVIVPIDRAGQVFAIGRDYSARRWAKKNPGTVAGVLVSVKGAGSSLGQGLYGQLNPQRDRSPSFIACNASLVHTQCACGSLLG